MPFPPTFDHVWDITQPPDTQAANLLGQDTRNLKDDIMQRLSLLAGTFANRPTPETVNATWGGAGFGLLYFATDVAQIYQWNGAAWVLITGAFGISKFSDLTQANFVNPAGVVALNTITVPTSFNTNGIVKAHCSGQVTIGAGAPTLGYTINGNASTLVPSIAVSGSIFDIDITLLGLSGVLMSYSVDFNLSGPPGGAVNNQMNNATGTFAYVAGTAFNIVISENSAFTGTVTSTGMVGYSF